LTVIVVSVRCALLARRYPANVLTLFCLAIDANMTEANAHFKLKHYFDELIDLPKAEQRARLHQIQQESAEIAKQLRTFLEINESDLDPIMDGARGSVFKIMHDNEATMWVGRRIDRYQVLAEIGRGGMGIVFKARREDGELQQDVAIKLLRPGVLDQQVLGRFLRERKFLASLRHPHICGFIDSGMTDEGTPYVVMEYLEGTDLLGYAAREKLSVQQRLQLFCKVLQGVAHAHRSLIIHRDIKPTNIFVDAFGNPKLLDFGIARSIDGANKSAETQQWFTADYGAPEQILGSPLTTACDIYSLGAVLFELLSEKPMVQLQGRTPTEIENVVVHTPAPRLELPQKASFWQRILGKTLDADLNGIVQKALRKEPEGRYASADEFAQDIENLLSGLPVKASGSDRIYRIKKFVQRNVVTVAAVTAVLVASLASVVVVGLQNRRVLAERDRAELSLSVLTDAFTAADPLQTGRGDVSVREVLKASSDSLMKLREQQPEDFVKLASVFAEVQLRVGLPREAVAISDAAFEIAKRTNDVQLRKLHQLRVRARLNFSDRRGAQAILGEYATNAYKTDSTYALLRADALDSSDKLNEKISQFEAGIRLGGIQPSDPVWVSAHWKLAEAYRIAKRPSDVLRVLADIEKTLKGQLGRNHPQVIRAKIYQLDFRARITPNDVPIDETLALSKEIKEIFGDRSMTLAGAEALLARLYRAKEKYREAADHSANFVLIADYHLGRGHDSTLRERINLALELNAVDPTSVETHKQFEIVVEDAITSLAISTELRDFLVIRALEYFLKAETGADKALQIFLDDRFQPRVPKMESDFQKRYGEIFAKLVQRENCNSQCALSAATCSQEPVADADVCAKLNAKWHSANQVEGIYR
jgi:eukaryotic-like serine/threonine-protein kinase